MNILRKFVFSEKMVAISICEYWKMDRNGAWLSAEFWGWPCYVLVSTWLEQSVATGIRGWALTRGSNGRYVLSN